MNIFRIVNLVLTDLNDFFAYFQMPCLFCFGGFLGTKSRQACYSFVH